MYARLDWGRKTGVASGDIRVREGEGETGGKVVSTGFACCVDWGSVCWEEPRPAERGRAGPRSGGGGDPLSTTWHFAYMLGLLSSALTFLPPKQGLYYMSLGFPRHFI